jgi:lipopolysaccharide transport system ATP-binding protein
MSSEALAVRVTNLEKVYQIYRTPRDRLKQFVMPRLRSITRRPPRRYYEEFWALKDVSFEIMRGETLGIIGRNGAGKSTLLQIICGTLTPTSGGVEINGRVAALLELGSGFNPDFTGRENIYMNGALLGLDEQEIEARFDDIAAFADIGNFIEQPVKTYSSGMFVRLAFAVIAHVNAEILVIDEALAVGDAFFVQKCMRFLRRFMERGTILFVSHDTGAVMNLCRTSIWLEKGRLMEKGLPKDIAAKYLAACYEDRQGESADLRKMGRPQMDESEEEIRDMRLDFINTTNCRNDVELSPFKPNAPQFGKGGAMVTRVRMIDQNGKVLSWVVGGEMVALVIECKANEDLHSPIVGFMVKDRLGQIVFADNTYLTTLHAPLHIPAGKRYQATFTFRMPLMPTGDYAITASTAEGTQHEHIQHHLIHEAMVFKVHAGPVCFGLIGVPMKDIRIHLL